jgi:hypothetical protein
MKVTSQTRSPTCVTPDVLAGKHVAEITFPAFPNRLLAALYRRT